MERVFMMALEPLPAAADQAALVAEPKFGGGAEARIALGVGGRGAGVDPQVDGLAKELVNQGADAEVLRDSGHGLALGSISSWPDISGPPCDSAAYGRTL